MISQRVSFWGVLRVESAGRALTRVRATWRIPLCGIPVDSRGIFGISEISMYRRFTFKPQIYRSRKYITTIFKLINEIRYKNGNTRVYFVLVVLIRGVSFRRHRHSYT